MAGTTQKQQELYEEYKKHPWIVSISCRPAVGQIELEILLANSQIPQWEEHEVRGNLAHRIIKTENVGAIMWWNKTRKKHELWDGKRTIGIHMSVISGWNKQATLKGKIEWPE